MPRHFIAIVLMLSLSFQCFVKLGIVVWYECNKSYVAKNLCENRARPERKCCGKCYLRKQLKKADAPTSNDNTMPQKWNMGEVAVYLMPAIISVPPFLPQEYITLMPPANERYLTHLPLNAVFRPPLAHC